MNAEIFKAYDIRGIYPTDLNEEDAYKIGKAYATWLKKQSGKEGLKVALGRDVRLSGPSLQAEVAKGLNEMGLDVVDLGVISTDMLYFAVANYGFDGGITISASHNPGEYNGMKFVREMAKPVSIDSGIAEIRDMAVKDEFTPAENVGTIETLDILDDYLAKMESFVDKSKIKPMKVVANANFGAAGEAISKISKYAGIELVKLNFEQDGRFPKGKPDPMQEENRRETVEVIKNTEGVDFGATWDADADRCFFYDENGDYIYPYYATGILIEYFLTKNPGAKILIDPRLRWLSRDLVGKMGGELVLNKSGHSFIKERMRDEDILFGAETSAHYYFKDLWFTDNGLVPFAIMLEILSTKGVKMSELVTEFRQKYPISGEINYTVSSVPEVLQKIKDKYSDGKYDDIDGVSIEYPDWRFNVRGSNTEPVLRLNIEAKTSDLVAEKVSEMEELIK